MCIYRLVLVLVLFGMVPASGQIPDSFRLKKHTETLTPKDHNKYTSWILSQHPSPSKKALLTSTLTSTYYPFTPTITWYKAILDSANFQNLLTKTYGSSSVSFRTIQGNYDYTPDGAYWIDFANAYHFGGGFRSRGNVQEERMFDEFPQLANLAYVLRKTSTILPITNKKDAEPFLVVSALRKFDVSKVPYGNALDSTSPKTVKASVVRLNGPYKSANIIGMAAKDYSKKHNARYSMDDLTYHLQAAFLGDAAALQYSGEKEIIIHTGRWGSGAFKNSLQMLTALQILAAEMAFSGTTPHASIIFHSIDTSLITSLQQEIANYLHAGKTPLAILKILKDKQDRNVAWRPQS